MAVNNPTASAKPAAKSQEVGIMTFPPLVHLTWGIILLLGNIIGNMLQVQSTQSWLLGGHADWRLDWGVWSQWPLFLSGHMTEPRQIIAFIGAWGAQLILMTSKIGTSFVQSHVAQRHATAAHRTESVIKEAAVRIGIWNFLAWGIIIIDSATDWGFSAGLGFWQQLFFVSVTFLMTFYFGSWGIMNIVSGIHRMKD